jgi:hypothetical protein
MKSVNPQNQVQAGNLDANGGVLGAVVGIYARKKQREIDYNYRTSLMDYDDQLETRRGFNNTVNKIVYDQTSQATADRYATTQEAARARNKMGEIEATGNQKVTQIKTQASQDRRTYGYRTRTDQKAIRQQTEGLEKAAGLPLSGGISVHVIKPGENAGQLQALQNTDIMKGQSGRRETPAATKPTTFAGASGDSVPDSGRVYPTTGDTPVAAKGGKGKKVKPFADPSVERNVKPVPDTVASPFSAPATRSTIFADASAPKSNTTAAATPDVATPKARIKKA